jgi:carbon storage regulator
MLVLRRKAGEAIVLNGVITIHVLAVEGERVKLGISAPPEVVIVRSELLENQGAMGGAPGNSYANMPSPMRQGGPRPYHTQENEVRGPAMTPQQGGYSRYTTPRPGYPAETGDTPSPFPSGPLRYRP